MTKITISLACLATAILAFSCGTGSPATATVTPPVTPPVTPTVSDITVKFDFTGPNVSPNSVYACWIENEAGENVKNVYVCDRAAGTSLTGDALPFWKTVKYPDNGDIDGITGASVQGIVGLSVTRTLPEGFPSKFRVYFEIDRSENGNANFVDRPSMIFRSELIDTGSLSSTPYALTAYGWMANDTTYAQYSQQPKTTIPGFATYKLMTDLSWIQSTADMVTTLSVTVATTDD